MNEKKYDLEFHWKKGLTVRINCENPFQKLFEFMEYHNIYPSSTLDNLLNFANWSANRNIIVYIYPYKKETFIIKIIFNIFIRFYKLIGVLSKKVIIL
jgi:hypothetical protein